MPFPTIVNTPTVGFAFTGNNGLFGVPVLPLTVTLPIPAEAVVGSLLLAIVTVNGKFPGVGAHANPIDQPIGWKFYTTQYGNVADAVNVLYRVFDGTEGPSITFQYSGPKYNFAGFSMNATILVIDSANDTLPVDAFTFSALPSVNGECICPGVTTIQTDDLVIAIMQPKSDGGTFSPFPENNNYITPGDPADFIAVVKAKQFAGDGFLADSIGIWSQNFTGPGPTGAIISPTGWTDPGVAFADQLVLAIGFGMGPTPPPPPMPPTGVPATPGELIGLTYDPPEVEDGQDVTAWHRHPLGAARTGGKAMVWDLATIPAPDGTRDELWAVTQRIINGRQVSYLEYLEKAFDVGDAQSNACFMDVSAVYSGPPVTVVFPLDHLEGETVRVLVDGATHPDCVVTNGEITLNAPHSVVQVGLRTPYNFATLRIEAGSQTGTAQAKLKRITKLNGIRLLNTLSAAKIGQYGFPEDQDELEYRDTTDDMDSPPGLFTGDMTNLSYNGDWERNGRIQIQGDDALPITIVALFPELDTTDG